MVICLRLIKHRKFKILVHGAVGKVLLAMLFINQPGHKPEWIAEQGAEFMRNSKVAKQEREVVKRLSTLDGQLDFAEVMIKCNEQGIFYFTGTVVPKEGNTSTIRGDGYADVSETATAIATAILGKLRMVERTRIEK